ncbi:MAG: carbon-nitrogen hydrolase family protein [Rhodobacteraceae bacterium]|nr:carbon-nitrogen hydrolase family protein [Paracoccaceae bacterium]MCY4250725.1 carbon-nitrogen hydrolase family protein [Paracoccaceae bacterium]MCY4306791.1 carbon-nitrogen hydrolase family protein [Paracoccaceae bacterium]
MVRLACLQLAPRASFKEAEEEIEIHFQPAVDQGAEFIFLPEYCGGLTSRNGLLAPPVASEENHPVLHHLQNRAKKDNVWVLCGSIAIEGANELFRNRSFVIDNHGEIVARYDKIHLFDIKLSETQEYRESAVVEPGERGVIAQTGFGALGLSVCYDLRFPHLYRDLAQNGAIVLAVPAAFIKTTGQAHWHVLNRARAIENGAFVVSPCAVGDIPGGGASYGHSLIVDPWGQVLADGGGSPCIIVAEIDIDKAREMRQKIPSLSHDRQYQIS